MSDKQSRAITVTTSNVATAKWVIGMVVAAAVAGVSGFIIGTQIDDNGRAMQNEPGQGFGQMEGAGGRMFDGMMGTVTEISSDSITIEQSAGPMRSDSSDTQEKTYALTSATTVTEDGDEATIDDIQVGDMVRIETDDESETATSISLGMPSGMGRPQSRDMSNSDSNASYL